MLKRSASGEGEVDDGEVGDGVVDGEEVEYDENDKVDVELNMKSDQHLGFLLAQPNSNVRAFARRTSTALT